MTVSTSDTQVSVKDLTRGMFVSGLDRPWTDTPFVLQGFTIESDEDILEVRKYCRFVFVDRNKSIGSAYFPDPSTRKLLERDPIVIIKPADESGRLTRSKPRATAKSIVAGPLHRGPRYDQTGEARVRAQRVRAAAHRREIEMGDGTIALVERISDQELGHLGVERLPDRPPAATPSKPARETERSGRSRFKAILEWFRRDPAPDDDLEIDPNHFEGVESEARVARAIVVYEESATIEEELPRARETMQHSREMLTELVNAAKRSDELGVDKAKEVVQEIIDSMERNPNALLWLTRLQSADAQAYLHSIQTVVYLVALGLHVGMRRDELADLSLAGVMLDVGKLRVPTEILRKPGRLNEAEFDEVKRHVQHSLDILEENRSISDTVKHIVLRHHEREDGRGYPHGLKGDSIGMYGRMAGLADTFVAITNPRPYAETANVHQALRMLYHWRGTQFHEPLVEQFVQAIGVFPVGALVELSTGDVAVVVAHNRVRRLKPRVLLLTGPDKTKLSKPTMLDLLYAPAAANGSEIVIAHALPAGSYGISPEEYYLG